MLAADGKRGVIKKFAKSGELWDEYDESYEGYYRRRHKHYYTTGVLQALLCDWKSTVHAQTALRSGVNR